MAQKQDRFFAVTPPGLETVCAAELNALQLAQLRPLVGGVEFVGGLRELYLANLWLRSASRVLVRLGELRAKDFPGLYKQLLRLPWGRFIKPGADCRVRATCHRSRLSHSGRVAATCRQAIERALGVAAAADGPESTVYLRLEEDRCQVSIDSSGELLHRRGYRRARVAAPLRENLAAACLLALGYDGAQPLVDAMTGSGTFACEAALIALRRAPGLEREFAFMGWPKYRPGLWQQLCREAEQAQRSQLPAPIVAVDNNPKAVAAAQQNLQALGLCEQVQLECRPMQQLAVPNRNGLLLCNPPYGERLGRTAALQALYRDWGRVCRESFADWQAALVCPDSALVRSTGVPFAPLLRFSNGGIRVALLQKSENRQEITKNS